jgi:hypothetical protein
MKLPFRGKLLNILKHKIWIHSLLILLTGVIWTNIKKELRNWCLKSLLLSNIVSIGIRYLKVTLPFFAIIVETFLSLNNFLNLLKVERKG